MTIDREVASLIGRIRLRCADNDLPLTENSYLTLSATKFERLVSKWPCAYFTNSNVYGKPITNDQEEMQAGMREGKYLWIDGVKVGVVIEDDR